ncbi:MAG: hypothetical protein PHF37_04125 [Phycisphaerae bacterium]|nr:hypothetical protein [Phycisphaerae bacterium]
MDDGKKIEKTPKLFLTVGPTLHYSHSNVIKCWALALVAYCLCCLFWSKFLVGRFIGFDINALLSLDSWRIGSELVTVVSIFEYPWQILVLGMLMGILAVAPVLISQLMSFRYSIFFIVALFFLANLPGFAIFVLISCFAAAIRPLRFRSRFIAIALCLAPQLAYWGFFGGVGAVEPIKWGFSLTPWICAWLTSLAIAGLVLGIGHFSRYRPGLVWTVTALALITAVIIFETKIGFDELDYQIYIAINNPETVTEFHEHSLTEPLDETILNSTVRKYLTGFFYPTESIPLRAELKREIQNQLKHDRWPSWFIFPAELDYPQKRQSLFSQYDKFINTRFHSRRMPIALYFKAILSEYSPDIKLIGQKEILRFYNDYPFEHSRSIWYRLYHEFSASPESIEARLRIARDWAGQGRFEQADKLLTEAHKMVDEQLRATPEKPTTEKSLFSPFRPPAETIMTSFKLRELQSRIMHLERLMSLENRQNQPLEQRLAKFISLNPYDVDYQGYLEQLLSQSDTKDPIYDNILLAKVRLIEDEQLKAERLNELNKNYKDTDGGMQALYEFGLLKIRLWRELGDENIEKKKRLLNETRTILNDFLECYPCSYLAEQVRQNLATLPAAE